MVSILVCERLGVQSWTHIVNPSFEIPEQSRVQLEEDLKRLVGMQPLQYVLGFSDFYGRRFRVGPAVLIPRPETELLVDAVLQRLRAQARTGSGVFSPKILDLCTGSGCIAWTLALECPNASVTALDISRDALALARTQFPPAPAATVASPAAAPLATSADAVPHSSFAGCVSGASPTAAPLATSAGASTAFPAVASGTSPAASPVASPASSPAASPASSPASSPAAFLVASPSGAVSEGDRVVFVEADVLDLSEKGISGDCSEMGLGKFDVIVSNPPYVMDKEKSQMRTNVLDYEPSIALFVPDDDPLIFYRAIAHHASRLLTDRGWGIVEINSLLANQTADCFRTAGFPTVNILPDLSGRPRFVHFSRI